MSNYKDLGNLLQFVDEYNADDNHDPILVAKAEEELRPLIKRMREIVFKLHYEAHISPFSPEEIDSINSD